MPHGMVATTISQASRSVDVSTRRVRSVTKKPRTMRTQSFQKNTSRARALATCRPTMKAR